MRTEEPDIATGLTSGGASAPTMSKLDEDKKKEILGRIRAHASESTDLAVETIERLTEACEEALKWAESPYVVSAETRARLRDKLREALGKPLR